MHIQSTKDMPFEQLHEALLDAYSDYVIPMNISLEQFEHMTRERCYKPELSLAAMDKGEITAFWLNGENERIEAETLYTISVGTRPAWRRQGLATRLFDTVKGQTDTSIFKQVVLEVITRNEGAHAGYTKMGFKERRKVEVARGSLAGFAAPAGGLDVQEVSLGDARAIAADLGDWTPTWQNSLGSLEQEPDDALCLAARGGGDNIGLGCFLRSTGQIKQLAVTEGASRCDVASQLLARAAEGRTDANSAYVNIDASDVEILDLLREHGWDISISQYEMVCPLT